MLSSVKIFGNNFGNYTPTCHPFTLRRSSLDSTDLGLKNNPSSRKCHFWRTEFFTPEQQSIVCGEMGFGCDGHRFPKHSGLTVFAVCYHRSQHPAHDFSVIIETQRLD